MKNYGITICAAIAALLPILATGQSDNLSLPKQVPNDWNDLHLIASGNELIHILNGRVMSIVIDNDVKNRRFDGLLGLQIHTEEPMRVEFRDIRLKDLTHRQ